MVSRFSRIGLCFDNWWKTHELEKRDLFHYFYTLPGSWLQPGAAWSSSEAAPLLQTKIPAWPRKQETESQICSRQMLWVIPYSEKLSCILDTWVMSVIRNRQAPNLSANQKTVAKCYWFFLGLLNSSFNDGKKFKRLVLHSLGREILTHMSMGLCSTEKSISLCDTYKLSFLI